MDTPTNTIPEGNPTQETIPTPPQVPLGAQEQQPMPTIKSPKGIFRHISGRTLLLIFLLATCTGFFVYIALVPQKQNLTTLNIKPTQTPIIATAVLTLENVKSTSAAMPKQITMQLDGKKNKVTAVQATISFDPKVIAVTDIQTGSFFAQPVELVKKIDNTTGRISYAVGIAPTAHGVIGSGNVATITYQILPTATGATTTLSFLPKTLVTAEGVAQTVLDKGVGVTIPLTTPMTSPASQIKQ